MIPTLFIVSVITFIIIQLPPGDFFTTRAIEAAMSGGGQDKETVKKMQERYGLDKPLHVQYWRWVSGFPRGDFGYSLEWNSPVLPIVLQRLGYTIQVGGLSLLFMIAVAVPIGIYSATHQYSFGITRCPVGILGLSLPGFLLALLGCSWASSCAYPGRRRILQKHGRPALESGESLGLSESPLAAGRDSGPGEHGATSAHHAGQSAGRDGPAIHHTARAKGLKEKKVVNKYGVRAAINPLISVMAMEIPKIISESTIVGIVMSVRPRPSSLARSGTRTCTWRGLFCSS
jgi:peptide/nickel transport system permease protein